MMSTRRALIALVAAVGAAALPAASVAGAGASPAGERLVAFGHSFDTVYRHGKPVKVKNFVYSNIGLECTEGFYVYSPSAKFPKLDVNRKRKFRGTLRVDGITSKVVGRFRRDRSKATGTVRATGATAGYSNCSGEADWRDEPAP